MKKRNTPIAAVLAVALTSATLYGCSDEQQAAAQGGQAAPDVRPPGAHARVRRTRALPAAPWESAVVPRRR